MSEYIIDINLRQRRDRKTIFKLKDRPFKDGVSSLNTLAKKYGISNDYRQEFDIEITKAEQELNRTLRKAKRKN